MNELMFEYLAQMGAMEPEAQKLKKKQAQIDALREQAMTPLKGQMIGKHYVAPGIGQAIAQVGTAYLGAQQQKDFDSKFEDFNARQLKALDNIRKRKFGLGSAQSTDQYSDPYEQFLISR